MKEKISNSILTDAEWHFVTGEKKEIYSKLQNIKVTLGDISDKILVGLQTSADPIYILEFRKENKKTLTLFSKKLKQEVEIEKNYFKTSIKRKRN